MGHEEAKGERIVEENRRYQDRFGIAAEYNSACERRRDPTVSTGTYYSRLSGGLTRSRYSSSNASIQTNATPKSNRFRKIVESAVQANRQVVESAQREVAEAISSQQHSLDAVVKEWKTQIDIWKEDSFDTATWLYHLVFGAEVTPSQTPNLPTNRLYQASVTDEVLENTDQVIHPTSETSTVTTGNDSGSADKALIVWSRQTEPSLVVDRLLFSWTTLSTEQIKLSSTRQDGDEWREDFLKMIEEANEVEGHEEPVLGEWRHRVDTPESNDEDFQSAEEESVANDNTATYRINRRFEGNHDISPAPHGSPLSSLDEWDVRREATMNDPARRPAVIEVGRKPKKRPPLREPHVKWQAITTSTHRSKAHSIPLRRFTDLSAENSPPPGSNRPHSRVHTILSDQISTPSNSKPIQVGHIDTYPSYIPTAGYPNPSELGFIPQPSDYGSLPPRQNPFFNPAFPSYPNGPPTQQTFTTSPQWPQPPPSIAPKTYVPEPEKVAPIQVAAPNPPDTAAKEKAIIATIEKLLEKRERVSNPDVEDPRFIRLEKLLVAQQERDAQLERDNAKAIAEAQLQQMVTSSKKDHERIKELERSNMKQREERRDAEARWKEERATLVEKAAKQAQEAKDLAVREIAAAQLAEKAAQKSLKLAKADIEKRAKDEADAKAAEEKRRFNEDYRQRMRHYEEQIREFQTQRVVPEHDSQRPVRRTCMSDGNRSIDVTEYTAGGNIPTISKSFSPFKFFQEAMSGTDPNFERRNGRIQSQRSRHDSFRSSTASIRSSRISLETMSTSDVAQKSQQLIVFPSKVDRSSAKISQMQTSLAKSGVGSVFEDPEEVDLVQLVAYEDTDEQVVRSTIFWEAPVLSLGSELLLTMKRAGWRPAYTRSSGKYHVRFILYYN